MHIRKEKGLLTHAAIIGLGLATVGCLGHDGAETSGCSGAKCDDPGKSGLQSRCGRRFDPALAYEDRLALLDCLMAAYPYPEIGGVALPDQRAGIYLQTEWQMHSGRDSRLAPDTLEQGGSTAPLWGWWPNVNWTLDVWQLEVLRDHEPDLAKRITELDGFELVPHPFASETDCFTPSSEVADAILAYYTFLEDGYGLLLFDAEDDFEGAETRVLREAQRLLWDLHQAALRGAMACQKKQHPELLSAMPRGEQHFAESWGESLVELLAATEFSTARGPIETLQGALPFRFVYEEDYPRGPGDTLIDFFTGDDRESRPEGVEELPPAVRGSIKTAWMLHKSPIRGLVLSVSRQAAQRLESTSGLSGVIVDTLARGGQLSVELLDHLRGLFPDLFS